MAPRVCRLCKHPKRKAIDKFLTGGFTFPEFQKKFRLRSVSIWTWSRHRTKHMVAAAEANAPEPEDTSTGLNVAMILALNKKLRALAIRCEKGGRPSQAVVAYSAISRNLELLARYDHLQRKGEGLPAPVFNITFAAGVAPTTTEAAGEPLEEPALHPFDAARAQRQAEQDRARDKEMEMWGKLAKDDLPN